MTVPARPLAVALTTLMCAAALSACGGSEPVPAAGTAGDAGEGATAFPLAVDNCGTRVTLDAAPQRVVSLDQGSTEILLSLGLGDRVVGTASWTDPVLPQLAEANDDVPRLADNAPSYEVVLGADPDFVTASFGRHLKQGGVAERARFAETGIKTYLSPTDCEAGVSINGGSTRTKQLEVDALYQEIRELASVFDVPSRGEALVQDLQQRARAATSRVEETGLTMERSGSRTPRARTSRAVWARRTSLLEPWVLATSSRTWRRTARRSDGSPWSSATPT